MRADNLLMQPSVEQIVKEHLEAAQKVRLQNRDPATARAFLKSAGIIVSYPKPPAGGRSASRRAR